MKKREDSQIIYKAALSVFSRFGYKKTTMEDIAGELGMTKGNLYLYARNKKSLYRDTISWGLRRWQSRVALAVEKENDLRLKFEVLCHKAIDYLSRDRELHRLMAKDPGIFPMFPDKDPFESINLDSIAMIRDILEQGIREKAFRTVDTHQISQVIFLIYKVFIIEAYIRGKEEEYNQMLSETLGLMTQGLFIPPAP